MNELSVEKLEDTVGINIVETFRKYGNSREQYFNYSDLFHYSFSFNLIGIIL